MNHPEAPQASQGTTSDAAAPQATPLTDDALDNASGGIIAILIGVTAQPKQLPGDGSVRVIPGAATLNRGV